MFTLSRVVAVVVDVVDVVDVFLLLKKNKFWERIFIRRPMANTPMGCIGKVSLELGCLSFFLPHSFDITLHTLHVKTDI